MCRPVQAPVSERLARSRKPTAQTKKDIKMQTSASQPHKQGRIPGSPVMSCAALASFLTWAPCSIGSAHDDPMPVKLSTLPFQVAGAKQAPVDSRHESSERPTRPTCAELAGIASTRATERTGESNVALGCGIQSNVADGTQANDQVEERIDVETFLAWHSQVRDTMQYASDTTLSRPSGRTVGGSMFKMPIVIAVFLPSVAFAAIPGLAPGTKMPPSEQSRSTHGARVSGQLSMGPDPGGKTGATVSPTTTKTGQPTADGAGVSSPSGVTSTAAPGVAKERVDPKTAPASNSATSKESKD